MASINTGSRIFQEIATLFASAPSAPQILEFRPSEETKKRAAELLELNRSGRLDAQSSAELDQFEQAELLMRLVKARIRSGNDADQS